MSPVHQLLHGMVQGQEAFVWAHLWTSTLVLAAALLASGWRRLGPSAREAVLSLGLAKLLVPGTALLLTLRAAGWEPWRKSPEAVTPLGPGARSADLAAVRLEGAASELPCLLALLWLCGLAAAVLARVVRRRMLIRALLRGAQPLAAEDPLRTPGRLDGGAAVILRGRSRAPFTFGTLRPVVVLPCRGELAPAVERSLLAHELAHVRRRDDLRAGLTALVAALYWFHPLAWIAARRLTLAREAACDRVSAAEVGVPAYLAALDHVCRGAIAPAGLTGSSSGALRERIDLLMDAQRLRFVSRRLALTVAVLAMVGGTFASGLAAPLPAPEAGGRDYRLAATVMPRGDALLVSVEVDDPQGTPLARPEIILHPREDATLATRTEDGRDVLVKARLDRQGTGGVRCRIRREGEVLFDRTVAIAAPGARAVSEGFDPAGGITFSLRDADVTEVLWTLARMAGLQLTLEGGVEGTVTIELQDVPWAKALDVITRTNDLRWSVSGDELVVSPAP